MDHCCLVDEAIVEQFECLLEHINQHCHLDPCLLAFRLLSPVLQKVLYCVLEDGDVCLSGEKGEAV